MSALDVNLQPLSSEELEPHVLIAVANPDSFTKFEKLLNENSYPCYMFSEIHDIMTYANSREGVIVFIEWDLPGTNVKEITKMLSDNMGNDVIVFSESDDIKTRAEIGSCGFKQTIQAPFSEKNFLMAVQKIQSDRKAINEKILRKLKHQQRMSMQNESEVQASGALNMVQSGVQPSPDAGMQSFSGESHAGGHEQFGGADFDQGHAMHKGDAHQPAEMQNFSGEAIEGGHSHFRGEVPAELQASARSDDSEEFSASLEAAKEAPPSSATSGELANDELAGRSDDELVDDLVHQLDDMEDDDEFAAEDETELLSEHPETEMPDEPDPEVLAEFRKLEEEHYGAEEGLEDEILASSEDSNVKPVPEPEQNWQDVQLPTLPQIGSGPQAFIEHQRQTRQKILQTPREGSFSSRDWMLMLGGIVLMLLLCSYFLAEVFIIPMMKGGGVL